MNYRCKTMLILFIKGYFVCGLFGYTNTILMYC
eukprot:UN20469